MGLQDVENDALDVAHGRRGSRGEACRTSGFDLKVPHREVFAEPRVHIRSVLETERLQRGELMGGHGRPIPCDPMVLREMIDRGGDGPTEPREVAEGRYRDPDVELRLGLRKPGAHASRDANGREGDTEERAEGSRPRDSRTAPSRRARSMSDDAAGFVISRSTSK